MQDHKGFLAKRRDRAIATIMSFKDTELDEYLPRDVSADFRKLIMDQINGLCNLAFDMMDDAPLNELYLERIETLFKEHSIAQKP